MEKEEYKPKFNYDLNIPYIHWSSYCFPLVIVKKYVQCEFGMQFLTKALLLFCLLEYYSSGRLNVIQSVSAHSKDIFNIFEKFKMENINSDDVA